MKSVFYSARDVAELIGCSPSKAYEIIRGMNADLKKDGYVVRRGKVPIAYFNEKCYGGVGVNGS